MCAPATRQSCGEYGNFVITMLICSGLLFVSYFWGRYYAAKLDYATTVQALLEDSDDSEEIETIEQDH